MPMAGFGSRYTKAGFKIPKPLIEVDGQPMYLKALTSLNNIKAKKLYTVIIRKEHDIKYSLAQLLKSNLPQVNIIISDEKPIGPVIDAYRAKEITKPNDGLIVMDCDLWFSSKVYSLMVQNSLCRKSDISGGLLTFKSTDPRYSYAKIGLDHLVIKTAEKQVISNSAITGAYFFATAQLFNQAASKLMAMPLTDKMPEYYLSFLYNILINEGNKIQSASVDEYISFGTPEELAIYHKKQTSS